MKIDRIEPGPGQESVWDYPRPPRLEPTPKRILIKTAGITIADSTDAWRVLETSHPPVYYIPPEDVRMDCLIGSRGTTYCEWKGRASYYDLVLPDIRVDSAAWYYPDPVEAFESIRGHLAFYPSKMDECRVDGELVRAQAGDFYGGWITSDIVGPFKGEPGTGFW